MFTLKSTLILVALAGFAAAAHAQENDKLTDCVNLPEDYQATRFGSQYLLVKDGDSYYRLGFSNSCSAISLSSKVNIGTEGQGNRLCPSGTKVSSKHDSCRVNEVTRVDQRTYEQYARKSR